MRVPYANLTNIVVLLQTLRPPPSVSTHTHSTHKHSAAVASTALAASDVSGGDAMESEWEGAQDRDSASALRNRRRLRRFGAAA